MTSKKLRKAIWLVLAASMAVSGGAFAKGPGSGGGDEAAGNNLSFPVIFAEGYLMVDGLPIYHMEDFGVRLLPIHDSSTRKASISA